MGWFAWSMESVGVPLAVGGAVGFVKVDNRLWRWSR
jgi:hypothetical protein